MLKLLKASVLATILAAGFTSPAGAMVKQQSVVTVFYEDDTYSNMVGQIIIFCDGTRFRSGSYSMYEQVTYYDCN